MLKIVGKKTSKNVSYGQNVTVEIYKNSKSMLDYQGAVKFNTGSTKGAESEVLDFLLEKKMITKKLYASAKGYYSFRMVEQGILSIQII